MTTRPTRPTPEAPLEVAPPLPPIPDSRRVFLDTHATSAGTDWSAAIRSQLRRQGRAASGGFPGTLTEARVQVGHAVGNALARARMRGLLAEEREFSARVAYAAARKDWLAHGERDDDDDDV